MRRMPTGKELKALENLDKTIEINDYGLQFNIPNSEGALITIENTSPEPVGSALGFDKKWYLYVEGLETFSFGYSTGESADTVYKMCGITYNADEAVYTINLNYASVKIDGSLIRSAENGYTGDYIESGGDKVCIGGTIDYYGGDYGIVTAYHNYGVFLGVDSNGNVRMWATENEDDGGIENCTFIILETTREGHIVIGDPEDDENPLEYSPLDKVNGYDFTTSPAGNADLECRKYGSTNPNLQVCDSIVANLTLTASLGTATSGQITLTQASGESVAGLEFTGVLLKEHTLVGACYLYGTSANTFVLYYQNATGQDLPAGSYRANLTKLKAN